MAEYIEREAVIDEIEGATWYHISCQKNLVEGAACEADALYKATDIYNVIKSAPIADVVEVVRCVCCGEIVPEGRQVCPQCERKRYIYTIPDIPPSLNKFAGRENVWAYRADKKQWEVFCAVYCRPKPETPIKKCVVRITYFFRTRQRHDPDNYNGKFILDGLREAGIIKDDSF